MTETNYYAWSWAIVLTLDSKNKSGFINGGIPELLIDDPFRPVLERSNTMVLAWLNPSMSSKITLSVMDINNCVDLWAELKQRFA